MGHLPWERLRKLESRGLTLILLVLINLAILGASWKARESSPLFGVLVRTEDHYILAWRSAGDPMEFRRYPTLRSALEFADETLNLGRSHSLQSPTELEKLWLEKKVGNHILIWKLFRSPYLSQITFSRQEDALYFADSFRRGAYSPSPFGHAVLLLPKNPAKIWN